MRRECRTHILEEKVGNLKKKKNIYKLFVLITKSVMSQQIQTQNYSQIKKKKKLLL